MARHFCNAVYDKDMAAGTRRHRVSVAGCRTSGVDPAFATTARNSIQGAEGRLLPRIWIKLVYRPPATPRFGGHIGAFDRHHDGRRAHPSRHNDLATKSARDMLLKRHDLPLRELAQMARGRNRRRLPATHSLRIAGPPLAVWQELQGASGSTCHRNRMASLDQRSPKRRLQRSEKNPLRPDVPQWTSAAAAKCS